MVSGRQKKEALPQEQWREAITFKRPAIGKYIVSNYGNMRHVYRSGKYRALRCTNKTSTNGSDRMIFKYCSFGANSEYSLHRIVWEAFNGRIPDGKYIVHRDMDYTNNALWNLKMVNKEDLGKMYGKYASMENRYAVGRRSHRRTIAHINGKMEIIAVYRSSRDAEKGYRYLSYQAILDRCNHRIRKPILPDGTTFIWEDELYE